MENASDATSIKQQCEEMGRILGLSSPVSEEVLAAAVADAEYAHGLLVARGDSEQLNRLLSNPPGSAKSPATAEFGTGALMMRAAGSLVRWARAGFAVVPEAQYRKRLEICRACPNFVKPPEDRQLAYKLAGADLENPSICGICGCIVEEKARRVSDTCPDAHPHLEGFNRWEEAPIKK